MCYTHNRLEADVARRKTDLQKFMDEVAAESAAAGESEALAAYGEHFRLARELIQMRKTQNWTQQQLAKASGVQQSEISRIESGEGNPTFRTLNALAEAADMTFKLVPRKARRTTEARARRLSPNRRAR